MLVFKNMRQRVEFAYDEMDVDIYYEGDYIYTVEHRGSGRLFEMLTEEQVDYVLNSLWNEAHVIDCVG